MNNNYIAYQICHYIPFLISIVIVYLFRLYKIIFINTYINGEWQEDYYN